MKTKRIISLLASLAMMVTAVTGAMTVSAETDSGDCGEVKWSFDSSTGKLTISGEGKMASPEVSSVTDPSDFSNTYTYKEHKEDIKEVVIEEGVTSIGFCSFYQFPNLETVVIPSTVKDFEGDSSSGTGFTPNFAFTECTSLKNLTLTEGMTCIGSYAFQSCTALESVTIPKTITDWGGYSFYKCSKLKDITLPEGLTIMGAYAFSETAVEHIVIPSTIDNWKTKGKSNVYSHEGCAFAGCLKLSSVIFKEGIKQINCMPFENCPLLKKVAIPASVTYLLYTFEGCTGIEEVYIEDGAQIGGRQFSGAFQNCTSLRKIEIPEGVQTTWAGENWCTGCNALTDVYVHGMDQGLPSSITSNESIKIHCIYGSKLYQSTSITDDRKITFKEEIPEILKNLNTAIEEAEKYAEEDYTTESYGALKTALENAKKYDENSTFLLPIEWAADDIMTAIAGLEEKKDEPSSSDPSDSSNPTDNSSDPSNSSDNNNQSQSPNTPATPPTAAPTTATPKPTTPPTVTTTVAKPAKVKSVKLKAKKKKLNVSWKKVSGATGYEVMYATNNKFTKNKKSVTVKKNKVTLKRLKSKKKYFVMVRAYKKVNGNTSYGKWSKVVKKKTK